MADLELLLIAMGFGVSVLTNIYFIALHLSKKFDKKEIKP